MKGRVCECEGCVAMTLKVVAVALQGIARRVIQLALHCHARPSPQGQHGRNQTADPICKH